MSSSSYAAYIDEAGDDGFTKKSTEWFVLSALVTDKADEAATLKGILDPVRTMLNKPAKQPLHFRKIKHHQKVPYIAEIVKAKELVAAVNVIIHKPSLTHPEAFNKEHRLYHYSVRLLLERVSWLCRDSQRTIGDGKVDIVFSNRGGMSYEAIRQYLDGLCSNAKLKWGGVKVYENIKLDPDIIDPARIQTFSHGKRMGLQVADAIASGIFNALEPRYGYTEDRYATMLKPIVYCYSGRHRPYGLKFFPAIDKMIEAEDRLRWVREHYPK